LARGQCLNRSEGGGGAGQEGGELGDGTLYLLDAVGEAASHKKEQYKRDDEKSGFAHGHLLFS
jgi:hypothetical protein